MLRKDFTIDEIQVYETRAIGADAMLLIVAALPDDAVLADLHDARASGSGSRCWSRPTTTPSSNARWRSARAIVGVNARNLGTFAEDLGVGERLAARVPADVVADRRERDPFGRRRHAHGRARGSTRCWWARCW